MIELIADVVPASRAKIQLHHVGPLEALLYRALWLFKEPRARFHDRVRAAFRTLEDGFDADGAEFGRVFGDTLDRMGPLQQTEHNLHEDAWGVSKTDPDRRFRSLLSLYQFTYERYYRSLAASFVVAHALANGDPNPAGPVDTDGRVGLQKIQDLEAGRGIANSALTGGLDNHLRNSTAHGHFDIVGDDQIRMWDQNPRTGRATWGPHEFSYWDLRTRVYALSVTSIVLLVALVLFDLAYGRTLRERGWMAVTLQRRRTDVLKSALEEMAEVHGFTVTSVTQNDSLLTIGLQVLGQEMPSQISQIVEGRSGGRRTFLQKIETRFAPAWKQVYGFLQTTFDLHGGYDTVEVTLGSSGAAEDLGRLRAPVKARLAMVDSDATAEDLRAKMEEDSLRDTLIPVVLRSPPQPEM